jgi:hypothetical protein
MIGLFPSLINSPTDQENKRYEINNNKWTKKNKNN